MIDYSVLNSFPPFEGDTWQYGNSINVEEELLRINSEMVNVQTEIDSIPTDSIPFDKDDIITVFAAAMIEVLMDFFFSDPANENSFASKCNNSDNPIGKWCNNVHEKIGHKGNPLDFQGRFDQHGNPIGYGIKHEGPSVSYGGGNHRGLTNGHDLLRFFDAIKQYHDGVFRDSSFIDGVRIIVESNVNQYGNPYEKLSWLKSVWEYICHMFADFFSSKGLPVPGSSLLSHSSDRELRKLAADLYADGFNLRTELLKGLTVAIPVILVRVITFLRYKDMELSKEAKKKKLHLMLLLTHGISTMVNVGKVIITENPVSINIPMILRTLTLVWQCIKDQSNYNHRIISKEYWEQYKLHLEGYKTLIIVADGVYETSNYQRLFVALKVEYDKKVQERLLQASEITRLRIEYGVQKENQSTILQSSNDEIQLLLGEVSEDIKNKSLQELVKQSCITDEQIENKTIDIILNQDNND